MTDMPPVFLGGRGVAFAQDERDRLERSPGHELCGVDPGQHSQPINHFTQNKRR